MFGWCDLWGMENGEEKIGGFGIVGLFGLGDGGREGVVILVGLG